MKKYWCYCLLFVGCVISVSNPVKSQNKVSSVEVMVGDIKIWQLQDGQTYLPVSTLVGLTDQKKETLKDFTDSVCVPINAYLIRDKDNYYLVDAGAGIEDGEDTGHLLDQLNSLGVKPEMIKGIFITHFHFDHVGGLVSANGESVFPNATVFVAKKESDFWLTDTLTLTASQKERARKLQQLFKPYQLSKKFETYQPNQKLIPAITVLPAYGHTVAHSVFEVESNGDRIWLLGDLFHFENIQFRYPEVCVTFDYDGNKAIETRKRIFSETAGKHILLGASHLKGFFKVRSQGAGYELIKNNP